LFTQRELARAHSGVSRALALVRDAGDVSLEARADDLIARIEHALGNVAAAREHFARSVERFHALGIQWGAGNALIGMAGVALATGDDAEAERLLDDAVSELRHTGPWFLARALFVRAILAMKRGHADETIALVRDSLTRIRDLQDKYLFMYALVPLAAAALRKGDAAWAARILGARDAVSLSTGATVVRKAVHDLREETEREARARLGQDRWAVAYAAGHRTSIDSILNEIDNVV
jgi:ATP/maltotriose-dependent transcriptional regulator MalT